MSIAKTYDDDYRPLFNHKPNRQAKRERKRRHRTQPTSREAFSNADVAGQCRRVLEWLQERGDHGATNDEIVVALEMPIQSVTPAVYRLREFGKAKNSGQKRKTQTGRAATLERGGPPVASGRAPSDMSPQVTAAIAVASVTAR